MPIGDYARSDVRTIPVASSLRDAARVMADEGVGFLVAMRGETPAGVLTDRDVALRVLRDGADPEVTRVGDVIAADPVTVHTTSPVRAASAVMRRRGIRRLPVLDEQERLVGVVSLDDLLGLIARELAGIAQAAAAQAPPRGDDAGADAAPEVE